MQAIGMDVDVILFGRMILNGHFVVTIEQIFDAAHDFPGRHQLALSVRDRQVAPAAAVRDPHEPHFAADGH